MLYFSFLSELFLPDSVVSSLQISVPSQSPVNYINTSSFDFWFFHEVYIFWNHFARKFTEAKRTDREGAGETPDYMSCCPAFPAGNLKRDIS